MSNDASQLGPLAFGDFLAHLRAQGFVIGVDHHLRLQQLLAWLDERCAPQDIKTLLCPIFATNEKEQELFYRAFDHYFALFQVATAANEEPAAQPRTADQTPRHSQRRSPLTYIIIAVLLIALPALLVSRPEVRRWLGLTAPTPTPATTPTPAAPTPVPPPGTPLEQLTIPLAPTPSTPPPPAPSFWAKHRDALRWAVVGALLLGFLLHEWLRYRRRKLILERARGRRPPFTLPLKIVAPELKDYRSEQFYRVVRTLRSRQVGEFHRLDVARTVAATIAARGYPSFQYRPDSRVPEYLVLIDRQSWRDHQAQLFADLTRALEREGIFLRRYFFAGDPRICVDEAAGEAILLGDLQKKYPAHRLLIFGNGEKLVDPLSGELAAWAEALLDWPERAVLTPEVRRGWREQVLDDHFILLSATLAGLGELGECYELRQPDEAEVWQADDEPPPDAEQLITVAQLRAYLGTEVLQWLCACAIYPELHWDLTLYLGALPCMGAELINEKNLLRLTALPWFRSGALPDELRLELLGALDPQRERPLRAAILELLEQSPAPAGSHAEDARRLEIAAQRSWLSRANRRQLRRQMRELKQFPPGDVMRDYALVRFLEAAPSSRLALLLPRRLRRLFYKGSVPAFGVRTGIRATAALAGIVLAWVGLTYMLPPTPVVVEHAVSAPPLELVKLPSGEFAMGSPASEADRFDDEGPQHSVTVPSFYIGKYEVTQAQWRAVMGNNPSSFEDDDLPVETVSWNEAQEFCRKLSQMTGRVFRLPTEAEWEYAARAGATTPFAFGSSLSSAQANFNGNYPYGGAPKGVYRERTTPVGSFAPNAFGLFDMHGNVWEWCEDVWHGNYNDAPTNGSAWLSGGDSSLRVLRGGSWLNLGRYCRAAIRYGGGAGHRSDLSGFRVAVAAR